MRLFVTNLLDTIKYYNFYQYCPSKNKYICDCKWECKLERNICKHLEKVHNIYLLWD